MGNNFWNTKTPASLEAIPLNSKKISPLLFILPIIYGVLASLYLYQTKAFFTTFTDSTYIYLINGANIASGNFAIGHYDNPGTTGHWLAAIIIFISYLFVGKGDLNENVLSNPELYLKICGIVCIALLLISVYASGKLIFKNTGNVCVALFFQLVPISIYLATHYMVRVCPEYLMLIILPYYCAYLWVLCFKTDNPTVALADNSKPVLFLSFITAVLIVGKITCVPFLIVPLFFIKKIPKKILYLFITFIFIMLLLFPVWPNLRGMLHWFVGLAIHTGNYGAGKEGIIDTDSFATNLKKLFSQELFFSIGYLLISIAMVVGLLMKKWAANFYKLAFAFWIVITAQVMLVAKHYDYHYLIPSQLLIIPSLLAAYKGIMPNKLSNALKFSLLTVCGILLLYKMIECATEYKNGNKMYESSLAAKKYADIPKIITTSYEESCFQESALRFGSAYGGEHYQAGYFFLRTQYPNSYFYSIPSNSIYWFEINTPVAEIFEKYTQLLIYFFRTDENTERDMIKKIIAGNDSVIKSITLIEKNYDTGEDFYLLDIAKTKRTYTERLNIVCDFEKKSADKSTFISTDGSFYFGAAELSSNEKHTSGVTAVKSTPKNQYTCWTTFAVNPGDMFDISVNNYSQDIPGGIVLSSADGKVFYKQSDFVVTDYGNGWKKINLKAKIPYNYPDKEVRFSLFYFGNKACYFDDLNIISKN